MIVTTLAPPAAEPVGLAEAKDYLRIAGDGQDELVAGLIGAARSRIEELTGVMMITRSLRLSMDWWPRGTVDRRWMRMPVRPAQSLIAVGAYLLMCVYIRAWLRLGHEHGPMEQLWAWMTYGSSGVKVGARAA